VRSLPLNATPEQLEEKFKQFGTIKHDAIQVRSHKVLVFLTALGTFLVAF
jgi:RNA recognition motif-containing protein